MDNQFDSSGEGEQNIAQGDHAIGRQENVTQEVRGDGCISSGTGNVTVNKYGVPYEAYGELAGKLAVTDSALASFFKILEEQQVPHSDLDSKLREIATQHKELLARVGDDQAAKQAIEAGDYAKAEKLLEDAANQHSLVAAEAHADNARIQRIQLRYAKAAAYWQKTAALLPEDKKKDKAYYLNAAGYDFHRVARYSEALPLYEQSLSIDREIGDKAGEGTTLNNISQIYAVRGDYGTALKYLEQSLLIRQEIGDKVGEGVTLNNISQIYRAQGDRTIALKYLEQSLVISREIGDKAGEGTTLNNIATAAYAKGDYTTALKYLEQSLVIRQEIGDKAGEAVTSWNIGSIYEEQGDLRKAEPYISRTVQLEEEISLPTLDESREALSALRAKLHGQPPGLFARLLQLLRGK